jgi:quinol monooxygenase YgiN
MARIHHEKLLVFIIILVTLLPFHVVSIIMSGPVALNVKFVLKPTASRADFLDALRVDRDETLATEPGSLLFVIGQDENDPHTIHLHEQYKSKSDLEYHNTTPHFKNFMEYISANDVCADENILIHEYHCQHSPVKHHKPREAYCLNVESCIKPEFRQEFLQLIKSHQEKSRHEPKCLLFDWGESPETPNSFYMHEEYDGMDGYKAHEASAHFETFMVFNQQEPYSKPQVVSFYKTIL